MATNEDITRLPKWAQQRIEVLERDKEHWKQKAAKVEGLKPETPGIFIRNGINEDFPVALDTETIRFVLSARHSIDVRIEHGYGDDEPYLYVMATGSAGDGLVVGPQSSNVLLVKSGRFRG